VSNDTRRNGEERKSANRPTRRKLIIHLIKRWKSSEKVLFVAICRQQQQKKNFFFLFLFAYEDLGNGFLARVKNMGVKVPS
jgi:hypothetical protein